MECKREEDWQKLRSYDTGFDYTVVDVWTYGGGETKCYRARVFIYDWNKLENDNLPTDKLPQERLLRSIASGMRHHGVDEEYIENEIMQVPYIPARKREDYLQFPAKEGSLRIKLISEAKYIKEANRKSWFAIGRRVFRIPNFDKEGDAFRVWVQDKLVARLDVTWTVSRTLFEPYLPRCDTPEELTALHHSWCEDMMVDYFAQADLVGVEIIGMLESEDSSHSTGSSSGEHRNVLGFLKRLAARGKGISSQPKKALRVEMDPPCPEAR